MFVRESSKHLLPDYKGIAYIASLHLGYLKATTSTTKTQRTSPASFKTSFHYSIPPPPSHRKILLQIRIIHFLLHPRLPHPQPRLLRNLHLHIAHMTHDDSQRQRVPNIVVLVVEIVMADDFDLLVLF